MTVTVVCGTCRAGSQRVRSVPTPDHSGQILCGGAPLTDPALAANAYFAPTLIDNFDPQGALAQEEIFGPVPSVNRFTDGTGPSRWPTPL